MQIHPLHTKANISFFLLLFIFIANLCSAYQYDLAVCMIFRDDAPYLKEWIEFHKLVGVQHFYLYNHNSIDDYQSVLQPYIDSGEVELTQLYVSKSYDKTLYWNILQCDCYTKALEKAREVCKWMAFIDSDEFLFPIESMNLIEFLKIYENCAGIAVNWQMFGTSNIKYIPKDKLLIETLVSCAPTNDETNRSVKSIVRPELVEKFTNPHYAIYYPGFMQVNTDYIPFMGPTSPYIQVNKLRINHYWTRDENYFYNYKIPQNLRWGGNLNNLKTMRMLLNSKKDLTILRYVKPLRAILQMD